MKRLLFILITALLLLTACRASAPQSSYVSAMEPVVGQLARWQIHFGDFETRLTAPGASPSGMSLAEMIDFYNMATQYQITREDYANMGFSPLDLLVGDANKFAKEGRGIQDLLTAATPDEDIKAVHEAVLSCVKTRVAFAEGISSSIRDLVPVDMSGDVSVCDNFDTDLQKLTDYVKANQ